MSDKALQRELHLLENALAQRTVDPRPLGDLRAEALDPTAIFLNQMV
jgi:hypothetical protein